MIARAEESTADGHHDPAAPTSPTHPGACARRSAGRRANLPIAELYEDAIRAGEGLDRGRGTARRPDRQAHRPLAPGQVHRRRAAQPRQDLVGRRQPADQRGPLRPPARPPRGLLRRARPLRPGLPHRRGPGAPAPPAGLHRDRLGEHLRAQPVPPALGAPSCVGFEPNFTIICVPVVPGRPGDRGHPYRDGDPRPPRADGDHHRRHRVRGRDQEVAPSRS